MGFSCNLVLAVGLGLGLGLRLGLVLDWIGLDWIGLVWPMVSFVSFSSPFHLFLPLSFFLFFRRYQPKAIDEMGGRGGEWEDANMN